MDDALAAIVRDAEADPNVVAAVLQGSRSVGQERSDSDYDVFYVWSPEASLLTAPGSPSS
jgi:predicted nucleotidyltransferase